MKVLFISDNDLISKRFNGYDYNAILEKYDIELKMLVANKMSNDDFVFQINPGIDNFTVTIIKSKSFFEADVIHLHLIHNTPFDINFLPLITRLKPTLITLHDCFFLGGHCIHHYTCEKWKTHCADCGFLDNAFKIEYDDTALKFLLLKTAIYNSFITAIVASDWMYNKVRQSYIWKDKKIFLLPFGVNQNIFKRADTITVRKNLGIPVNNTVLMFRCQENNPYKGLDIILHSLKNIQSTSNITLIAVGTSNNCNVLNNYKKNYDLKVYDWITDDNILSQLYQASDIFLMPSKQEAFGLMAVEAMCCGKMVLATTGTALESIINHPHCGIAVEHNADIYLNELQRLLNNKTEIIERGDKSYSFAKETYSETRFYDNLVKIYKDVINYYISCQTDSDIINNKLVISQINKYNNEYLNINTIHQKSLIFRIKKHLIYKLNLGKNRRTKSV
jgi:glycosyltransferase involved in cell wall biosynthesis